MLLIRYQFLADCFICDICMFFLQSDFHDDPSDVLDIINILCLTGLCSYRVLIVFGVYGVLVVYRVNYNLSRILSL